MLVFLQKNVEVLPARSWVPQHLL